MGAVGAMMTMDSRSGNDEKRDTRTVKIEMYCGGTPVRVAGGAGGGM